MYFWMHNLYLLNRLKWYHELPYVPKTSVKIVKSTTVTKNVYIDSLQAFKIFILDRRIFGI